MRTETGRRRAALDGLLRILEAAGLEELFGGPDEEALFLYHLLHEVSRGRSSPYYWEICHTGRRRGVTPEYVSDRASVLLASIEERRRTDIYRVLGVPPLASEETIKVRWHEVAKAPLCRDVLLLWSVTLIVYRKLEEAVVSKIAASGSVAQRCISSVS